MNIRVAVLDNDPMFLAVTKEALESHFEVTGTTDTNEFIDTIEDPAVVVLDWFLDYGIFGIEIMRRIRAKHPLCHFIFISSLASKDVLMQVINEGCACNFIEKDKTSFFSELVERIAQAKTELNKVLEAAAIAVNNNQKLQKTLDETLKTLESSDGRID